MRASRLNARRIDTLALAVRAVHPLLLRGVHHAITAVERAAPDRPLAVLNVRTLPLGATPRAEPAAAAAVGVPAPTATPTQRSVRSLPPLPQRASAPGDALPRLSAPTSLPSPSSTSAPAEAAPPPVIVSARATPASSWGDLPIYRTLAPPAFAFSYELRRGAAIGNGELQWRQQGEHHEARLVGTDGAAPLLAWQSSGGFDDAGLAPAR